MTRIPGWMDEADHVQPIRARKWYAVYTNPKCEARALLSLREAGLEGYLPQVTQWVRHARKRSKAERPLFLRYLFVSLDADEPEFFTARLCDGVDSLVGVCGRPSAVPAMFVHRIREAERAGEFDETHGEDPSDPYRKGDPVRVKVGSKFAGWPGKVLRMTDARRVEVLLQGIGGKETLKTLDVGELEAA